MSRKVDLKVENNTSITLNLVEKVISYGKFTKEPPTTINSSGAWSCDKTDWSMYGTEGYLIYENIQKNVKIKFFWDHPFGAATSSYKVEMLKGEEIVRYSIKGDFTGHDQNVTYILDLI